MPGGIVDPGEHPADAAARECFEEAGVAAVPEWLTSVTVSRPETHPTATRLSVSKSRSAAAAAARQFADGDRNGDGIVDSPPINVVVLVPSRNAVVSVVK